jgi:uncharacterized membrane protein
MPPAHARAFRLTSIDALRGIVMVIMALDHVRDFFHADAMVFRPEGLERTYPALFFTRWVTHVCAPVFFLVAGVGACLWLTRTGRGPRELSRFLWTRGLWLIVLELTVLRFGYFFSLTGGPVLLTVLWALGWSMIALAGLCRVPVRVLVPLSLAGIALHHVLDPIRASQWGPLAFVWNILHQPGAWFVRGVPVVAAYPLIPWVAVMAAGFGFGRLFIEAPATRRQQIMLWIGAGATVAFFGSRWFNLYGDPAPWSAAVPETVVMSFFNATKYPPSLIFLLMTLGPAIAGLAWLDRLDPSPANPVVVIGRVPLFFFLAHFLIAHLLAIPFAWWRYGHAGFLAHPMPSLGGSPEVYPPGFGYSLGTVYVIWIMVVLITYPLCAWLAGVKERRRDWWLGYV